jgi:hypothetical protein
MILSLTVILAVTPAPTLSKRIVISIWKQTRTDMIYRVNMKREPLWITVAVVAFAMTVGWSIGLGSHALPPPPPQAQGRAQLRSYDIRPRFSGFG